MRFKSSITGRILLLMLGFVVIFTQAQAHHSIAGMYDTRQQVTIEATITDFQFINPHPFLVVTLTEENDGARDWRLEMDNRRELRGVGMTEQTFKPGDRVLVVGNPSRSEDQRLYIRRLERSIDGFVYEQVGTRPRISGSR